MSLEDHIALVEQRLPQHPHLTLTEAAALTGLSIDTAREALDALLSKYVCRLQVTEYGDLIYNFGDRLRRRGVKTWPERWREIRKWLWQVFTVFYKAWITVTLVVYFVLFIVLLIVAVLAASSGSSSSRRSPPGRPNRDRPSSSASFRFGPLLRMFASIFHWQTSTGTIDQARDQHGYRYQHYQPEPGVLNTDKKNFVAAVYDFVFGPPRVALDPLQNEKEVAAYLERRNGIVVASELSALAGWTFAEAETFLTDCVIRYQGETKISDAAILYGQFDTITRGVGGSQKDEADQEGQIVYYWDEYEPAYELTGNSSTHNAVIIAMNSFNLLLSLLVLNGSFDDLLSTSLGLPFTTASLTGGAVMLGWIPLVFSVLFFLIPACRLFSVRALQRQQHEQNIRKRLFHTIFAARGQTQTLSDILTSANTRKEAEETLSAPVIEERLKTLVLDMPGDMQINEAAEIQFSFPRITREMQAVPQLRNRRRLDDSLGQVIVESDNQ